MKVLSIETSSVVASVAISDQQGVIGEMTINHPRTHSQKLMPMVKDLFETLDLKIDDIDVIAVSNGPGSFTGVRIGLTTAKALAHSKNIPLVTFSTLDSLAMNVSYFSGKIISLVDGRREKVFVKETIFNNNKEMIQSEETMGMIQDYIKKWNASDEPMILIGSGVRENKEIIKALKKENITLANPMLNYPYAKTLGMLLEYKDEKDFQNYDAVKANYIRRSQAEMSLKE